MTDSFYTGARWKNLRRRILARAKFQDQLALREGRQEEANTVHHIFPRDAYPEYQYETWNLIAISGRTHKLLHTPFGDLSEAGWKLLKETAARQGVPISKLILVIGLPGAGKTTLARKLLRGGIAYDLDYIAAAFRLRQPHAERHAASRRMANAFLKGFIAEARNYSGRVIVVRSAPDIEELIEIDPDEIYCAESPRVRKIDTQDMEEMKRRIEDALLWGQVNGIPVQTELCELSISPPVKA